MSKTPSPEKVVASPQPLASKSLDILLNKIMERVEHIAHVVDELKARQEKADSG